MKKYFLTFILALGLPALANDDTDHNIMSLWGVLDTVVSPTKVIINLNDSGDKIRVVLRDIKTPYSKTLNDCDSKESLFLCKHLEHQLKGQAVGIVPQHTQGNVVEGDLVYDGKSISVTAIESGYYKINTENTRSVRYLIAERLARCKHRGIWYHLKGNPLIAKQCQTL